MRNLNPGSPDCKPRSPSADEQRHWRNELGRIRAVARRRRLLGHPDPILELGCAALERRLAEMGRADA
jgi:hypothetical protein